MARPAPDARLTERFPVLRRLEQSQGGGKIPFLQQLSATDCGPACLAMVLGYFGKDLTLDEVRQVVGANRDGSNALALLEAGRWFGLRGRGVRIEVQDLEYLQPGAILHWEFKHFVVFDRVHGDAVEIVDPAMGR